MAKKKKLTGREVLDIPMNDNAVGAADVRDYLKQLLAHLWDKKEGFDGKRPWGNSGWEYDLYDALIAAGAINKREPGYGLPDSESDAADKLIFDAIEAL